MKGPVRFLEDRLGLAAVFRAVAIEKRPPRGIGWLQTLGYAALTVAVLQVVTGIALAFHYVPSVTQAYDSVRTLDLEVPGGMLVRSLHHTGASAMVILLFAHVVRVYFMGAYKKPRELTWLAGVGLFLVVAGFGFTGYLLPWDQKAYFATKVGVNIAGKAPLLGEHVRAVLVGGDEVGGPTLTRFFAIHVLLLPIALLGLLGLHLYLVQRLGMTPPGRRVDDPGEPGPPYHPFHTWKEVVVSLLVAAVLFFLASRGAAPLEAEADPADLAYDPRPDWYFFGLFQLLKVFEGRLEMIGTFVLPNLFLLALVLLPFLDRNPERRLSRRPVAVGLGLCAVAAIVALTVAGALDKPGHYATPPHPLGAPPEVKHGYLVVRRGGCLECHTVEERFGKKDPDFPQVPDLTAIERSPADIASVLGDPEKRLKTKVMPSYGHLSKESRTAVGLYLRAIHSDRRDYALPPESPQHVRGRELAIEHGCFSCHALEQGGKKAGRTKYEAPEFHTMSQDKDSVAAILEDPGATINSFVMPAYAHLDEERRKAIGAYIESLSR